MNKLQSDNLLNALCLHDNDNILITLKNLNSGMVLNEYGITMDAPASVSYTHLTLPTR